MQAPGEQQELEATVEQLMAAADGLEQSVAQISALGSRADAALADAAGMAAAASHSRYKPLYDDCHLLICT